MAGGVEHRIDGDGRLVVEQHDQLVADADEGQLLAGDVAEVHTCVAVQMKGDGRAVLRFLDLEVFGRVASRWIGAGQLREKNRLVHRKTLPSSGHTAGVHAPPKVKLFLRLQGGQRVSLLFGKFRPIWLSAARLPQTAMAGSMRRSHDVWFANSKR